jgi:hypothetical protein
VWAFGLVAFGENWCDHRNTGSPVKGGIGGGISS